jgi:nucleoside-triphosphatase
MKAKNILITGRPRVGKSTFIKSCAQLLHSKAGGFFTEEILGEGIRGRRGFRIVTLSGQTAILAEVNAQSSYHVGRYGIFLEVLDEIAVPTIYDSIASPAKSWILIDEIGKMEEGSDKFKQALLAALNSPKRVLATIRWNDSPFTEMIKERPDVEIVKMTVPNRESLTEKLHRELQ